MRIKKGQKKSPSDYLDISKRFREIRLKNNLTQKEFGEIVGLSAPAVGAIENGLYTPNFKVLRIIKQKFHIDYAYIIDGDDTKKNPRNDYDKLVAEVERLNRIVDKLIK